MRQAEIAPAHDPDGSAGIRSSAEAGEGRSLSAPSSAPPAATGSSSSSVSKLAMMDLAYTEYMQRRQEGESLDLDAFCASFPPCRSSLRRLLQTHQFLFENPDYLGGLPEVPWPKAGERHGDLTLLRELGRGSFARVFLATEASTGDRLVVVKFSVQGDAEARTMGRLSHSHIVPILSARVEESSGLTAVCMPYLGSATLEDVLDRAWPVSASTPQKRGSEKGRRPRKANVFGEVLRACAQPEDPPAGPIDRRLQTGGYAGGLIHLAVQLAEALAFVHRQQVCHRDLKPSNVLLDPSGKPLLLDFNLSTSEREGEAHIGGTLRYMAPEQLRAFLNRSSQKADHRADLFALAVTFYELLAGDHPYGPIPAELTGVPLAQFLLERMNVRLRPLREVCPELARPVAAVLDRCLAVDPSERPRDATEVAAELKRQFSPARRMRGWIAAHPLTVLAMICLFLLGTAVAGFAWSRTPSVGNQVEQRLTADEEYHLGRAAYLAGNYDEAEEHFNRAVKGDPKNRSFRRARGVARIKQSQYLSDRFKQKDKLDQAFDDINETAIGRLDDPALALKAYMLNCDQQPDKAIDKYTDLLKRSYLPVMALNNRGYSYFVTKHLPDSRKDLDEAARLNPYCQAVRYNRAMIALDEWNTKPIPPEALDDIDHAIRLGPITRELYRHAAELYALAACDDLFRCAAASFLDAPIMTALHFRGRHRIERSLFYVGQAIANGWSPTDIRRTPHFHLLDPLPAFTEVLRTEQGPTTPPINLRLVDPVELPH